MWLPSTQRVGCAERKRHFSGRRKGIRGCGGIVETEVAGDCKDWVPCLQNSAGQPHIWMYSGCASKSRAPAQVRKNSRKGWEESTKWGDVAYCCLLGKEGTVFSKSTDPAKLSKLQWKASYPRIFGITDWLWGRKNTQNWVEKESEWCLRRTGRERVNIIRIRYKNSPIQWSNTQL